MGHLSRGEIREDFRAKNTINKERVSGGSGSKFALGVAKVITVNYEEFTVTLRVVLGEDQEFQRAPVAMTFPGAGSRHFFGAMPMVGDYCVIGHLNQESHGGTTTPVILAWIVSGTWTGHDWLVTQPFSPEEYSFDPKDSTFVEGTFQRVRHKLPHIEPGNVVASSAQGSDIFLDESVYIANRRCNEIMLRDQDQAFIVRSLQQFHAMAGTRIYAGIVQRDAALLPTQMISDGGYWDGPNQVNPDTQEPHFDFTYGGFVSPIPRNQLDAADVFSRVNDDFSLGDLPRSGINFEPNLDPYDFLERGLFITSGGYLYDSRVRPDAVYGGKPIYRTSILTDATGKPLNSAVGTGDQAKSLTEYRIEVSHVSDGQLPVTEQTDGFDADRLPRSSAQDVDPQGLSENAPFIEFVMGSVVGNDPFSLTGRDLYGIPLKATIFSNGTPDPKLESALGSDIGEHAATLFKLSPPTLQGGRPTFWSVTKDGRVKFAIEGPKRKKSIEGFAAGDIDIFSKGQIKLKAAKGLKLDLQGNNEDDNKAFDICCNDGGLKLYGGGRKANASRSGVPEEMMAALENLESPSLELEGRYSLKQTASELIHLRSNLIEQKASQQIIEAMSSMDMSAGDRLGMSARMMDMIVNGKATQSFHGPKDGLPTNGALRTTRFSGTPSGAADETFIQFGDRTTEIEFGNDVIDITVGNIEYTTFNGFITLRAGQNLIDIDSNLGITLTSDFGNVEISSTTGAVTISGATEVTIESTGPATLSGTLGVTLGGPGPKSGGIVSASDLDPLTGLPLATFGMGSPGHTLGPPV